MDGRTMEASIETPLRKVVKGTVVALLGSVLGLFLVFLSRMLMARYLSVAEYGVFSLAFVILNVIAIISMLGLERGVPRQVAFLSERGEMEKVSAVIRSSATITVIASSVSCILLFALSDSIAQSIFQTPELAPALRIFSISIPFFTLLLLLVSVYRGFDRADVKVYFSDVMRNVLFFMILGLAFLLGLSFEIVLVGFVISIVVPCVGIGILIIRRSPVPSGLNRVERKKGVARELLFFSAPLMISAIFALIMSWTDTITLGYFRTVEDVGVYNAALPIAQFVPIFLNGMAYIYLPVVSKLHSMNRLNEIRRMYGITTKWIFSLTYPLFLVVVLFPRPVIGILFGADYTGGSLALQILIIGFFVHTFLGLNASTLLALGETKYLMWASAVSAVANVILNVMCVSWFGIPGAALATALSLVLLNILVSWKCHSDYKIHPFSRKYIIPIAVSIPAILAVYLAVNLLVGLVSILLLPMFFIIFLIIYFLSILLTKGFDQEDLDMIASVERRLGLNFRNLKKILKRFL